RSGSSRWGSSIATRRSTCPPRTIGDGRRQLTLGQKVVFSTRFCPRVASVRQVDPLIAEHGRSFETTAQCFHEPRNRPEIELVFGQRLGVGGLTGREGAV